MSHVFELALYDCLGVYAEFSQERKGREQSDVEVVVHGLPELLKDHFFESIDVAIDLDIHHDLLPVVNQQTFYYYGDRFCHIPIRCVHHGAAALQSGLDYVNIFPLLLPFLLPGLLLLLRFDFLSGGFSNDLHQFFLRRFVFAFVLAFF